jgi:hypothetical protein
MSITPVTALTGRISQQQSSRAVKKEMMVLSLMQPGRQMFTTQSILTK